MGYTMSQLRGCGEDAFDAWMEIAYPNFLTRPEWAALREGFREVMCSAYLEGIEFGRERERVTSQQDY